MGLSASTRRVLSPREISLTDFSGGLNLRDSPSELANNETPDCWNVTLDERGGFQKRRGQAKKNPAVYTTGSAPQHIFEWGSQGVVVTQCGASLFHNDDVVATKTFTTAARVGFAEFGSSFYTVHPVDGLFSSTDAVTWTLVASGPKGTCLAAWQNRLVVGGDPAQPTRLYASGIGDATDWLTTATHGWTVDLREKDSEPIVLLEVASGEDINGRPGLIVCKRRSTYRVYDPANGSYLTLSATAGAASSIASVAHDGLIAMINETGIYVTDGVAEPKLVSQKLQPLFQESQIAFDQPGLFCAGAKGDRLHFSLPRAGSTANDLHLEYHPQQGWIVPHSDAASCYATTTAGGEKLYGGSPTVAGQVYEQQTGGTDDGAAITCRYQAKWLAPAAGLSCQFRRLRVFGRGFFDLYVKLDFDTGDGDLNEASLPGGALVWDGGLWDDGLWGPVNYEDSQDFWSLGHGTHISFVFKETGSALGSAPALLGLGTPPEVGAFAVYGLNLLYTQTGA